MSSKMRATYKKNIKKDPTQVNRVAFTFIHLPRHTSQSGCPLQSFGHLLLVEDQNSMSSRSSSTSTDCTPAPSNPSYFFGTTQTIMCHVISDFSFFFSSP